MNIMDRICALLEERGMKNKAICDAIGINASTFSTWKYGHMEGIPSQYIAPLARLFGMSCDELLTGHPYIDDHDTSRRLMEIYGKLDWEGQQIVVAKALEEQRRMESIPIEDT